MSANDEAVGAIGATASAANGLDGPKAWAVALAALACLMLGPSSLLVASFGVFQGPLAETFGWRRGQIGFAVSLMAISIMIAAPLQGVLIDRFGVRRVVLISIPCLAAGAAALYFLPPSLTVFYIAWAILPFLATGIWPVSYLKAVSGWFDRRLGLATGVANAGIGIGTIILPPTLAAVIAAHGVRAGFLAMGALALAALPIALVMLRERPASSAASATPAAPPGAPWTYLQMVRAPAYRRLILGFFLLGVTGTGLLANLIPIIKSAGATAPQALAAMAVFGMAALFGRLFTGWMLDRFHAAIVVNLLVLLSLVALLALTVTPPALVITLSAIALGLLSGGEFDVLAFTLRRYFGLASFGKMYGAAFSMFQLGAALGAAALAMSVARTGDYALGLYVFAAAVAGSGLIFLRLPPYPEAPFLPGGPPAMIDPATVRLYSRASSQERSIR